MDGLSNEKFLVLCRERIGDRDISKELYDQDRQDKKPLHFIDIPFYRAIRS